MDARFFRTFLAACHSIWKGHTPNSPSPRFWRTNLLKVRFVRNFPDQSCPAVVGRDDESVAFAANFNLEISNFAEREASNHNIIENLEAVVNRSTGGSRKKCRLSL